MLRRKAGQVQPRVGGYGGGQGGGRGAGTTHPSQMSVQEKLAATCKDWNSAGGCTRKETFGHCFNNTKKLRHGCSKVNGSRLCWDASHKESEHP